MHGTVTKKGNRWYAVVYEGRDEAGKPKRRWISAGTRKADAERVLADLIRKKHEGEPLVLAKGTLGQYLTERWLPVQESRLRRSTYDSYRRNIDLHVLPALGQRQLAKLSPGDLDLFYADLLAKGRRGKGTDRKGLAPKTVRNIHVMLNKALSDAQRKGLVVRNVAELADPPKLSAQRREEVKAWDADQLCTFLDAIAAQRFFPAFHLSAHTGMRRGEVCDLTWPMVDWRHRCLRLPESKTGKKTVPLSDSALDLLRDCRARAQRRRARSEYVVPNRSGAAIRPSTLTATWIRIRNRLPGFERVRLHDLRHSAASDAINAGVPLAVVGKILGHRKPSTTARYAHISDKALAEGVQLMGTAISENSTKRPRSHRSGKKSA